MTHLSDEELQWVKAYELGDTILFKSSLCNSDTLVVADYHISNSRNPFFLSLSEDSEYLAYTGLNCAITSNRNVNMQNRVEFSIIIQKSPSCRLYVSSYLGGRFTQKNKNPMASYLQLYPRSFSINGRTFHNCIVSDSTNSGYNPEFIYNYPNQIQEFVWSKEYGLIYYKYDDGEYFVRKDLLE